LCVSGLGIISRAIQIVPVSSFLANLLPSRRELIESNASTFACWVAGGYRGAFPRPGITVAGLGQRPLSLGTNIGPV